MISIFDHDQDDVVDDHDDAGAVDDDAVDDHDDDDAVDDDAVMRQHGEVGSALMLSIKPLSSRQLNCKWKYTETEFINTLTL